MPLELPKALLDAGGWTVATVIAIGIIGALIRGDLVTGRSAKEAIERETSRADRATEQLERNSDIGERLVVSNDKLSGQVTVLVDLLARILRVVPPA